MQALSFQGMFHVGKRLMPANRLANMVDCLKEAAPNFNAEEQFQPKNIERIRECADAAWCAGEIVSGRNRSEEVGNAVAAYARRFSQDAYMTNDPLRSLTAITVLGHDSVRRSILGNKMGTEVAKCLRSAVMVGQLAQRHAAALVLSRYAIDAAEDFCNGGILMTAVSALTDVMSILHDNRSRLYPGYAPLMLTVFRSLASVARYVGQSVVSVEALDSLRAVARMDEIAVVRESATKVAAAIEAKPKPLHCGPTVTFGSDLSVRKAGRVAA